MHTADTPEDQADAEAATWIARLHAEDRSQADADGFYRWLAQDPRNQAAFEAATLIWDAAAHASPAPPRKTTNRREMIAAGLGVAVLAGGSFAYFGRAEARVYETAVGEQKDVTLADNSTAFLDTDTRIVVRFSADKRLVDLERGRVNFHVAPDPGRLFEVSADRETVIAQQSDFSVRRDNDRLAVLVLEGRASVKEHDGYAQLASGDRLLASPEGVVRDRPALLPLLAWKKGQAILENERLSDAVAEMNRYSVIKIEIRDSDIAKLRFSGVYKVGDNIGFAHSVARLLPLRVQHDGDRVLLFMDASRMRQG